MKLKLKQSEIQVELKILNVKTHPLPQKESEILFTQFKMTFNSKRLSR